MNASHAVTDHPDSRSDSQRRQRGNPGESLSSDDPSAMNSSKLRGLFIPSLILVIGLGVVAWFVWQNRVDRNAGAASPTRFGIPSQYSDARAMDFLNQLCALGPRPSGSPAMKQQQEMLTEYFEKHGATVSLQSFETKHPEDGSPLTMSNLIAAWHPDRPKRYLICAHYDTRPYPDSDPRNPRGTFIGANDGASGTAGLMELATHLGDLPDDVGVDLVMFDGEEFVWKYGRDKYFLGSTYFAQQYIASPPSVPYRSGILLDMIGDRELKIYYELNSYRMAKGVCQSIWKTAQKLGVRAFVARTRHKIDDDHIPLNNIAKIPTVDLIDFDYPRPGIGVQSYWHTEQDVPENCSGESIAAVVWVVHEWLKEQ